MYQAFRMSSRVRVASMPKKVLFNLSNRSSSALKGIPIKLSIDILVK
jgi:hypothetical protein